MPVTDKSEGPGVHLPARFIPTPPSISPEAQAFLNNRPPFGPPAHPALDDLPGWRAYVAAMNQGMAAYMAGNRVKYPAEVTTHQLSACTLYEVAPETLAAADGDCAILYIHGGGFITGGGEVAALMAMQTAHASRIRTYSVDYRMPPDHPFPHGLDDCMEAYRWMLERYAPHRIAITGASAGGNLAPAMILKARALGLPLPAACAVHSPAADLTETGDSFHTNQVLDIVLQKPNPDLMALYCGGYDPKDPLLSPAFADFSGGFPPTVITSGTRDLLLSSAVMLHRALRGAGVRAELHIWEAMTHGLIAEAPEARELMNELVQFMRTAILTD